MEIRSVSGSGVPWKKNRSFLTKQQSPVTQPCGNESALPDLLVMFLTNRCVSCNDWIPVSLATDDQLSKAKRAAVNELMSDSDLQCQQRHLFCYQILPGSMAALPSPVKLVRPAQNVSSAASPAPLMFDKVSKCLLR